MMRPYNQDHNNRNYNQTTQQQTRPVINNYTKPIREKKSKNERILFIIVSTVTTFVWALLSFIINFFIPAEFFLHIGPLWSFVVFVLINGSIVTASIEFSGVVQNKISYTNVPQEMVFLHFIVSLLKRNCIPIAVYAAYIFLRISWPLAAIESIAGLILSLILYGAFHYDEYVVHGRTKK